MCEACGKSFASKEYLRHHSNIHTGSKPYKCEQCGRGFAQRNSLHQHLKIHTGNWILNTTCFYSWKCVKFFCLPSLPSCLHPDVDDTFSLSVCSLSNDCQVSVRTAVKTVTSSSPSSTPSRGTSEFTPEKNPTCVVFAVAPSLTSPPSAGTLWLAALILSLLCNLKCHFKCNCVVTVLIKLAP